MKRWAIAVLEGGGTIASTLVAKSVSGRVKTAYFSFLVYPTRVGMAKVFSHAPMSLIRRVMLLSMRARCT